MPPLNVLMKPASGNCNMRCRYCFYADETKNRSIANFGMMSEATAEQIIIKSLSYAQGNCAFGFQGGEPTLRGLDFFSKFVSLVEKHNINKVPISLMLQTNGLLINEEWAAFFHKHHFLIGLSLDGDKERHNCNRLDTAGNGTFNQVLSAARLFDKFQVEYNILTVVTAQVARHIQGIYRFFMKNGFFYQQYIPCLDPLGTERGQSVYSLTPEDYQAFLIRLFDLWYEDRKKDKFVYVRYFENLAAIMLGRNPESCGMTGGCSRQLVVEADGSAYPCDFYMLDEYKLGNLNDCTIPELEMERDRIGFIRDSVESIQACNGCPYLWICRGGCRRDRQGVLLDQLGQNYFCKAYQAFFAHAIPKIASLLGR